MPTSARSSQLWEAEAILYILAAMQLNFADEWQRLTRLYEEKSDDELLELSADFADLTETAQQVLRDELRKRRLPDPAAQRVEKKDPRPIFDRWAHGHTPERSDTQTNSSPHEYTWKTLLCECLDREHAWQISEMLRQAGIESWTENPAGELDMTSPRVLVAADQLDDARAIAEAPIPQDIIDQSKVKEEDFTSPVCPKCGASDPLLIGVEPSNTWRCDVCGVQWTDSPASDGSDSEPQQSACPQ